MGTNPACMKKMHTTTNGTAEHHDGYDALALTADGVYSAGADERGGRGGYGAAQGSGARFLASTPPEPFTHQEERAS